ncbi:MAG: glycoside hydrolase domain-containing protein, partial [Candidatus Latescibacterota bacterium]
MESIPYGLGQWPVAGLGNHRAVVRVDEPSPAVRVCLPWRRRDLEPERKEILVFDATTGVRVTNVVRVAVTREYGELVFAPLTVPGEYYLYYLPQVQEGWQHSPVTRYLAPESTADPHWVAAMGLGPDRPTNKADDQLPVAVVVEIQAVNDFHRLDPMEVPATAAETAAFLARYVGRPYLLFPEDRRYPIRMRDELPCRWLEAGPAERFHGTACRGEFFAFQLGVLALGTPVTGLSVAFGDLRGDGGHQIPAAAMRCINTGGADWLGRPLRFELTIPPGTVYPLWCGVQVPVDAPAGEYRGTLTLCTASGSTAVEVVLQVVDEVLADAGDRDLWRQARLRWLDSDRDLDEQTVGPYPPIVVQGRTLGLLGREVHLGDLGLPDRILTRFDASVQRADAEPEEILAGPIRVVAT